MPDLVDKGGADDLPPNERNVSMNQSPAKEDRSRSSTTPGLTAKERAQLRKEKRKQLQKEE